MSLCKVNADDGDGGGGDGGVIFGDGLRGLSGGAALNFLRTIVDTKNNECTALNTYMYAPS